MKTFICEIQKADDRQMRKRTIPLPAWVFIMFFGWVLGPSSAMAQFSPIPLSGGPLVKMVADFQRPYIYAIAAPSIGTTNSTVLFINVTNDTLVKVLLIGNNLTDMSINVAENKLYVLDRTNNEVYGIDLVAEAETSSFKFNSPLSTISGLNLGRFLVEGQGNCYFCNTWSGLPVSTNWISFDGDAVVDSSGSFYFMGSVGGWPPAILRWEIQGDYLSGGAPALVQQDQYVNAYGSYNVILSHDNSRLFYNGNVYDTNLDYLAWLGAEVFACSSNGAVAFTPTQVFDGTSWLPMYNLPVSSTAMAVDGYDKNFWYYDSVSNQIESLPMPLMQKPVILQQPTNQIIVSGNTASISLLASGRSPLFYTWYFNGTNFANTTTNQIFIPNFQSANAGTYSVLVTNAYGSINSSNAVATISFIPPTFTNQPVNVTVAAGSNATMTASAAGSLPITYQWAVNGLNINGATNPVLNLTNLQLTDIGNYDVVAANGYGSTTSTPAYLNVVDLNGALNTTNIDWITGGDVPWQVEFTVTHDGYAALQSGSIATGQQSILQTTVTGPGTLTFWWGIGSDAGSGYNYLTFLVNGIQQSQITFISGWILVTNYLGDGQQALQWSFTQPLNTGAPGAGYLDQVNYLPGGTSPYITLSPTNQVVLFGSNAVLNAAVIGTPPLGYQWQLNGTNVAGATNTFLALTNAQFANGGNYSLVISNELGVTNTAPVFVNVVDFTGALNATNLTWTTGGNAPWFPETSITHDGVAALQSGAITGNQQSTVQTTVTGPGTVSFWWQVSSETNNDYVNFVVDGLEQARISGTVHWQPQTFYFAAGTHTLSWSYNKNATINSGSDAAWLDQVSYTNGTTPAFITSNPSNQTVLSSSTVAFSVGAQGTPPLSYQWLFNGTNIITATNSSLMMSPATWTNAGTYSVVVSNAYGAASSSTVSLGFIRNEVVAWGMNTYGQTNVPSGLTNPVVITAGYENSLTANTDGSVTGWGQNNWSETVPPAGLSNVLAVATSSGSSSMFTLALMANGTITGWGNNVWKQTSGPTNLSNIVAISAGQIHGMALRNDGKVFAWGNNSSGQTNIPTALTNAIAIAAGNSYCLALQNGGSLIAWGDNTYHQTNIPPGLTNVVAIAAGWYHCLALKNNGTITAWGDDNNLQTNVPPGLTNVIAIAAGQYHSLAVKGDGTVVAWGQNSYSQTNVPAGLNRVVAVAGGAYHSLALVEDGPPLIFLQPASQTNYAGYPVVLSGSASGLHPINFQWLFDGTNIAGATNSSLTLNLQPNVAGVYSFVSSNALGTAISSNAVVVVLTNAPAFALQPTNQTIMGGSNVTFSAAIGAGPIPNTYQWQFNGTNIIGATNLSLTLTGIQLTNQGNYSIVASNAYGATASSNAYLFVLDLPTALNEPTWTWINTSSSNWFPETTVTYDGYEAAQSGTAPYLQYSTLQTTLTGPGAITFWWKFWPQGGVGGPFNNSLSLSSSVAGVSWNLLPTNTWQQSTIYLGTGTQTVSWIYSHFYSFGQSTGWVDQVSFTPGGTAPTPTYVTPNIYLRTGGYATLYVNVYGTPPLAYQWQFNGTNLPGQTHNAIFYPSAQPANTGTYTITVTNSFGSFSTNITLWVGQFGLDTNPTNTFMSGNGFQMNLDGVLTTNPVVIFGSTDLVNWLPLFTNPATTGTVQFIDSMATNLPTRFYRAQE